ncbi:Synaptojanin-2-binding protein [Oryzias melastigma]|uniref:Synaptojanin-2-binding protein n=1 Tax=Oryzias melastigma TaxID=30732 RepID=A0A834F455_ORYME|nr:Synaptojanin-2-binding protein [Oryzias melastigma]
MNGSLHPPTKLESIILERGPTGLGFNIVGGLDQQYVQNDTGIYVSKIKEGGAAALDGRLQEGDRILSINGVGLEHRRHRDVVDLFRKAEDIVELQVVKKPKPTRDSQPPEEWAPSALPVFGFLLALAVCAALVVRKFRPSN